MRGITFVDTEVSVESNRIQDIGAVNTAGAVMHEASTEKLVAFLDKNSDGYVAGHNIVKFDCKYLKEKMGTVYEQYFHEGENIIDTLFLSSLLFPKRPYHKLLKDDKLDTEDLNNPVNDAKKSMQLFQDEAAHFLQLPEELKRIYYELLHETKEFAGFFHYMISSREKAWEWVNIQKQGSQQQNQVEILTRQIKTFFHGRICSNAPLGWYIRFQPIELSYALALIWCDDENSITPPWIVRNYPYMQKIMHGLRGIPCKEGCVYCRERNNAVAGLKYFFGYDAYRAFNGVNLQEQAVEAAIENESLLAVFPTGGGKSITFQVPALMAGQNEKGLTVIISPLQSLMQDQVYNLERAGITDAVTINGMLDPIERAEAIKRVRNGDAKLLYIAPESLRSRTIEKILVDRNVVRFVIDEAHCFSSWGQDFRVDYLYIGEFIRNLCQKKHMDSMIPVSCFTATAKQNVIQDINKYFQDELGIELKVFAANASRTNLSYRVIQKSGKEKYDQLRYLLSYKKCPTIIYVSRTKDTEVLSQRLSQDGYAAKPYHGKMDKTEKSKNQKDFIEGNIDIMVATSAFGMGVDKKDVQMVIHYDISDSLENYVQEAGRAGRDQKLQAECFVLYDEQDLNKHFSLLNQTKINIQEIQQIWKAIKDITKNREKMSASALEIARRAGWEDNITEIETRVKTAVNALEEAGYIKRGQNMPRVFADSILAKNVAEARNKIEQSNLFSEKERETAVRIIVKLISSRSRKTMDADIPESRVDYIADDLGVEKREVIHLIQMMRMAGILADAKDLTAFQNGDGFSRELSNLKVFYDLEQFLLENLSVENMVSLKQLNENAQQNGVKKSNVDRLRTIFNFWVIEGYIFREKSRQSGDVLKITLKYPKEQLKERMEKRHQIAAFVLQNLGYQSENEDGTVQFSVKEMVDNYNYENQMLGINTDTDEVENALLFLSKTECLKLEGGFLVTYNALSIQRLERDNKIRYKADDYKKLKNYYEQKVQMIHIVGEYARMMTEDYQAALKFVDDYFQLEYGTFLKTYFRSERKEEIERTITQGKFEELFGELSPRQLQIVKDKDSSCIVVAAGPGSGKTKILVHKLASLLLLEDVKHEQMVMLTFSRAAAVEFKLRLRKLIGDAAAYVEIKTFHSYCFDLLGRLGNIDKSDCVVQEAVRSIRSGEVEQSKITKTVVVIDEAQDMDENEYQLILALMEKNDDIRVIAVGDDDQNIYAFRGSDSIYMKMLLQRENSKLYELVENYRSVPNLVKYSNLFARSMKNRMKSTEIVPVQKEPGKITIVEYQTKHLIVPVVEKSIADGFNENTCIMTQTNDEALQIAGLLQNSHVPARLIQEDESFKLYQLCEVHFFTEYLEEKSESCVIPGELWNAAKEETKKTFLKSKNLELFHYIIRNFENTSTSSIYISDWKNYMMESKLSDFFQMKQGEVIVSTMHKSKGHEFNHVILVLNHFNPNTEEKKRLLYVAMTRAKKTLTVHYNGHYMIDRERKMLRLPLQMDYENDDLDYADSNLIRMNLGYKDVFLSYFYNSQEASKHLVAGEAIKVDQQGCMNQRNQRLLLFSKTFKAKLEKKMRKGYCIKSAKVNYVVYWKQEDAKEEVRVVLPEIEMVLRPLGMG